MMGLPARFQNRLPAQKRGLSSMVTAGLGAGSPPYVSIQGGQFTLIDAGGQRQAVETKYLDCVIFDANYEVPIQRVFWGDPATTQYNPNSDGYGPPVCYSDNGIGASAQAAEPQSTNCQTCEWNKFKFPSKVDPTKKTKACNAIKKLAVLPVSVKMIQMQNGAWTPETNDSNEVTIIQAQAFPFLLRVPIMSHEHLRSYGLLFQPDDVPFDMHEVVTRISFVPQKVGVIRFDALGHPDERIAATIERFLVEHHTDVLVGRGDVPWQGEAKEWGDKVTTADVAETMVKHPLYPGIRQEPAQASNGGEAPKRGRPRKQPEPVQAQSPDQVRGPVGENVPAFLRRTAQPAPVVSPPQGQAASPSQANFGVFGAPGGTGGTPAPSSHGIVQAQGPTSEMAAALDKVFGLKT